jgi:uncharacterized protein YehS (DUF1456 family)
MDNNDIFRRIRYILNYNDEKISGLFALANHQVPLIEIGDWLQKEDNPSFKAMSNDMLDTFLNGLIIDKRGKKENAHPIKAVELNNNIIFRKLKIAFQLRGEDIMEMFELIDKRISKHEISAFLRNPEQRQYRDCNDQYLRNFLSGIQKKIRG